MIWGVRFALLLTCLPVWADDTLLPPFSSASGAALPAPWRVVGLPKGKAPLTAMDIAALDGQRVLRLASQGSYGTAVHEMAPMAPVVLGAGTLLSWRWRLDQPVAGADLSRKEGDDAPLKVCALFDMALDRLGFWERNLLQIARALSGEKLPAATLCYVWDQRLPVASQLPNAFTPRVRYRVLDSAATPLKTWVAHQRDLALDFQHAFGHESPAMPPLVAIGVGADSDNTQGSSLGYVGDIRLTLSAKPTPTPTPMPAKQ
jgi:hypothetical protein